jgi:hypothetical protein
MQRAVLLLEAGYKFANRGKIGIDLAQISHFPLSALFRNSNRVPFLGCIDTDENCAMLTHGSSSCAEARLAHANNPR